ncbi:MAG: BrnT family toxin [Pseudomonadota bacterium]
MQKAYFEWNDLKNRINQRKRGISFSEAQLAFLDPNRVIAQDLEHANLNETRYYCFGKVRQNILTVRFTYRNNKIRIFGAGYWRKGRKIYEKENKKRTDG